MRALGGFPGPYTKDFNYRVGGDGLRALLDGAGAIARSACWDETLVLAREGREMVVFTREKEYGDGRWESRESGRGGGTTRVEASGASSWRRGSGSMNRSRTSPRMSINDFEGTHRRFGRASRRS